MYWQAIDIVTMCLFGKKINFGVNMMDHSNGIRGGLKEHLVGEGTCWPHLRAINGAGLSCLHEQRDKVLGHLDVVHMCHTEPMIWMFTAHIGAIWEKLPMMPWERRQVDTLWDSYMTEPWNIWSIGNNVSTPCYLPSNNCVESWIKQFVEAMGRSELRGSTAKVKEK